MQINAYIDKGDKMKILFKWVIYLSIKIEELLAIKTEEYGYKTDINGYKSKMLK